jgi:hypothetical protein
MHSWTIDDDVVTLYLYMYGDSKMGFSIKEIGEKLGMGINSLRARIGNFKAIEGQGGFSHYAKQSFQVYNKYHGLADLELRRLASSILEKA